MNSLAQIEPVDYLLIGHVTQGCYPTGFSPGGTVSYSGLTARAFGKKVGIVTAAQPICSCLKLEGIPVIRKTSPHKFNFENLTTANGRVQHIRTSPQRSHW